MMKDAANIFPVVKPSIVADEVLVESVAGQCTCPACGSALSKSVFADGDTERCGGCGAEIWFELRSDGVYPHQTEQVQKGTSLGELLRARGLPGKR